MYFFLYSTRHGRVPLDLVDRSRPLFLFSAAEGKRARNPNPNQLRSARAPTMAASLRSAAMRILRPSLLPGAGLRRLVHTETKHSGLRASPFKQQKEELYDLIAKASSNSAPTWQDRLMLHHLCTQIEPRPNDPQWCKVIRIKKGIAYTSFTGFVATTLFVIFGLAPNPKVVEYDGHLVTAESLPMIQERLSKQ